MRASRSRGTARTAPISIDSGAKARTSYWTGKVATITLDRPQKYNATDEEMLEALMQRIKGPDFPTSGLILGTQGIGPVGDAAEGGVCLTGQQHRDFGAGLGVEMALRELADHAVPEGGPRRGGGHDAEAQQGGEDDASGK